MVIEAHKSIDPNDAELQDPPLNANGLLNDNLRLLKITMWMTLM